MNGLVWLMRMRAWAQNPPSMGRVKLVVGIVVACVALASIEYFFGWPEWLTLPKR
jgi:hypothetical protein